MKLLQIIRSAFGAAVDQLDRIAARNELPLIKKGSTGDHVEFLQHYLGIDVTGTFDDRTDAEVREFQRIHALRPDGDVGPSTWAVIYAFSDMRGKRTDGEA
jgi:peptidoglycan hydrolase-like protein with peptidoglycan-binding domain